MYFEPSKAKNAEESRVTLCMQLQYLYKNC